MLSADTNQLRRTQSPQLGAPLRPIPRLRSNDKFMASYGDGAHHNHGINQKETGRSISAAALSIF
jgi:hypothetical protein